MNTTPKHIVVLGAAESGVGAAILAATNGLTVFVSDAGPIKDSAKMELEHYAIDFEEHGHTIDRVLTADLIVKSPGIPESAHIIKALRSAGVAIVSEIEFETAYQISLIEDNRTPSNIIEDVIYHSVLEDMELFGESLVHYLNTI